MTKRTLLTLGLLALAGAGAAGLGARLGWLRHIGAPGSPERVIDDQCHPLSKADRMATLNKQKLAGVGSAPAPLVSAKMFDFPGTVVMTGEHQPHSGKPVHVTRVWIKHDGQWVMAISFQTAVQAAAAKT